MKKLFVLALFTAMLVGLCAEQVALNNDRFEVSVWADGPDRTEISYRFGAFDREAVDIDGQTYYRLSLPGEDGIRERGLPELPRITRALAIGDDAYMEVNFLDGDYTDLQMNVVPSKGEIFRDVDPATVPYAFGDVYSDNAFYPAALGDRDAPYIMRDIRGVATHIYPFQYNPVTGVLRVWTNMRVEVVRTGVDTQNVKANHRVNFNRHFFDVYSQRFVNLEPTRYDTLSEAGSILVVSYGAFMDEMLPWVEWKIQKGFEVEMVDVNDIGPSATDIKDYIQDLYDDPSVNLTFVLLVGDAGQVPTFTSGGGGSDPTYSLLEGTDSYPDIFVGRFSAETESQVETQVERSIYYERDINDQDAEWLHKGMGIASSQGSSQGHFNEADYVHIGNIRDDLLNFTYTEVDQIYDNNGGNASMVTNGLNEGRSIISYCGHGSTNSWVSTGFNNNNVNALTNDNKLPFIISVACVNGNFVNNTCFAEAWLRATNGATGAPTGAIANYSSSINQSWAPPMDAEDEIIDLLVGEYKNTTGGLFYNGSCKMIDINGGGGVSMFKTWHIFGDPSLQVRTDVPTAFVLNNQPTLFLGLESFEVDAGMEGAQVCLSYDGQIIGSDYSDESGSVVLQLNNLPEEPCELVLTVTGFNKITSVETVELLPNEGAYLLIGDPVYSDGGNNVPEFGDEMTISVAINNVGADMAYNAQGTLLSQDAYVTIIDSEENIGNIDGETSVQLTDAFTIVLADNVPDLHEIEMVVHVVSQDGAGSPATWEQNISIVAHGPDFSIQPYHIFDSSGNNNGRLDPGETVSIQFPVENIGSCDSPEAYATLVCNNPHITIESPSIYLGEIATNVTVEPLFSVTLSDEVEDNEVVPLGFGVVAGGYFAQATVLQGLPARIENFENGLNTMNWSFRGDAEWSLNEDNAYEGVYSLRSGVIDDNESSTAEFTYNVTVPGEMVFYRNVSSESNQDYLRFYIDGQQRGQWSGLSQWLPVTIEIEEAGEHTFAWTYSKDSSQSAGGDCAWIDFISFPGEDPQPVPIIAASDDALDFNDIELNGTGELQLTVFNYGTMALSGNIDTPDGFTLDLPNEQTRYNNNGRMLDRTTYPFDLAPMGMTTITVVFEPTQEIDYDGFLVFSTNDPYAPEFSIELETDIVTSTNGGVNPYVTELGGNFPNPFNPETTVTFSLGEAANTQISVYNVRGQLVKTLVNERLEAGNHTIAWRGVDANDRQVGSGVYFLKMFTGRYTSTKKMILLK